MYVVLVAIFCVKTFAPSRKTAQRRGLQLLTRKIDQHKTRGKRKIVPFHRLSNSARKKMKKL